MPGNLTMDELTAAVGAGEIDTVLVCMVDMQGRLMGKRFQAEFFLDSGWEETHACNYLLTVDMDMEPVPGYKAASWAKGYGDLVMKSDLSTIRVVPWLEKTAMLLCDLQDPETHADLAHSPRGILRRQVARLTERGYLGYFASELEFYLFNETYDSARAKHWQNLETASPYIGDYLIGITTKEEGVMRPLRNHLYNAGIPIENSKGEAEAGQEELNIRYDDALNCADYHTIAKNAIKEIAWQQGHAVTFLPKWDHRRVGSSSHVHQSLWRDGKPAFFDENDPLGMSDLMRHYMAGLIKYAPDYTYFLAPYVNSYKRFAKATFAPTKTIWSIDNRTAGFRLCGANTKAVRVECRIGGSDMNPYLAQAAQLAAGIRGIEDKLELDAPSKGDVYAMKNAQDIPRTLRASTETLRNSDMLKEAMGEDVVAHYTRAAEWEQEEFDAVVTDWEISRGFERS